MNGVCDFMSSIITQDIFFFFFVVIWCLNFLPLIFAFALQNIFMFELKFILGKI